MAAMHRDVRKESVRIRRVADFLHAELKRYSAGAGANSARCASPAISSTMTRSPDIATKIGPKLECSAMKPIADGATNKPE